MQHVAQFLVVVAPLSEVGSVSLAQRTYQRIAVLAADLAVFVSVSRVDGTKGDEIAAERDVGLVFIDADEKSIFRLLPAAIWGKIGSKLPQSGRQTTNVVDGP